MKTMSKLDVLIEKYKKQFDKYGMGSGISYSELISDLEKLSLVLWTRKKKEHNEKFNWQTWNI